MKRWLRKSLALGASLLVLSQSAGASQRRHNEEHQDKSASQSAQGQSQEHIYAPPLAFYGSIRDALDAIAKEIATGSEREHADHEDWSTPSFWINAGLVAVGFGYTVFALLQWLAIRKQYRTIMDAERPLIILRDLQLFELTDQIETLTGTRIVYEMRNPGRGIAFIEEITARLAIFDGSPINMKVPSVPDYSECMTVKPQFVIAAGDKQQFFTNLRGVLDSNTVKAVTRHKSTLVLYGFLKYSDVHKRCHKHGFGIVYFAKGMVSEREWWNHNIAPQSYRYDKDC